MVKKIRNIFVLILSFCIFTFNTNFVFAGLVTCGSGDGQNPCTIEDLFGAGDASKGDPYILQALLPAAGKEQVLFLTVVLSFLSLSNAPSTDRLYFQLHAVHI